MTYKSGGRESQIDFLMCRRQQLNEVKNGKVINGESVAAQHRELVRDWEIKCSKRRVPEQVTPKIKWWRLEEENLKIQFKEKVLSERRLLEELGERVWSVVRQENEREDQGEGVQNSGNTSTDVRGRDMGVEEGTGKEIECRRNENDTMDVRSYEAGQDQK